MTCTSNYFDNIKYICPDTLISDVDARRLSNQHNRLQVQRIKTISSTVEYKILQNLGSVNELSLNNGYPQRWAIDEPERVRAEAQMSSQRSQQHRLHGKHTPLSCKESHKSHLDSMRRMRAQVPLLFLISTADHQFWDKCKST